jgi:hypothetical protein
MSGKPGGWLALDLSTTAGFAYGHDFSEPTHGVWKLGKDGNTGRYFSCLAAQVESAIALFEPCGVIFEAPLPPQAQSGERPARVLLGLAAVVEMICFEQAVPCEEATVDQVRTLVLGRSRFPKGTSKEYVMQWARGRGLNCADDNAADACALLHYRHTLSRMKVMAGRGSAG